MFVLLIIGGTICCVVYLATRHRSAESANATEAELQREVTGLRDELDGVRQEMAELAERVDFAERMLAKQRESERLSPPKP